MANNTTPPALTPVTTTPPAIAPVTLTKISLLKKLTGNVMCLIGMHDIREETYIDSHGGDDGIMQCSKCRKMW